MNHEEIYIPPEFEHCRDLAIEAARAGVDLEMLARNLSLSPAERLTQHQQLLETIEFLHTARRVK